MAETLNPSAGDAFEKIAQEAHQETKGAQTLSTLANGAVQFPYDRGPEKATAIEVSMKLAAQQRMAKSNSPMEPKED